MGIFANISGNVLWVTLLTGVLPVILWLFFWLREDRENPEPPLLLFITFIVGALSVLLLLPLTEFVSELSIGNEQRILLYAAIEEITKFGVVYLLVFKSPYLDEPIDYAIYLITGALGFAMMENIIFLLNPAVQNSISFIINVGILRFLGATILHAILAATLGIILGFVFYKTGFNKLIFFVAGISIIIILHTIFNYFIIKYVEINSLLTLGILWIVTIVIISLFDKVRKVTH